MRAMIRIVLALSLIAVNAACGDGSTNPPAGGDTVLVVSPATLDLAIGEARVVAALLVIGDSDTVIATPSWTSRDAAVASVTSGGVVTGEAAGVTRVIAAATGRRDSVAVTVRAETVSAPRLQPLTSSLSQPVFLTSAPGDFIRLFVVEKTGAIRILRNDTLLASPFLDLAGVVSSGSEQGLLSMAFHPDYATNGYAYVSYTDTQGTSKIVRYQASGAESLNAGSALQILSVSQPY